MLELYVSRTDGVSVARGEERARIAAEEMTREGTPVRLLRAIFVPDDETGFYLCEAASVEAVRELAKRAELPVERLAKAVAASPRDAVSD